ncbi:ArsR/SmtB family transcription factor [Jannaschia marina]|uniref:ArsR/SmtB family transcription factor n=1 Tax=Jannaschia marina TaxID=2741674 RepID=UPI0015C784CE|nr:metalloregulator ArsR/SmtB family transcription factor [Jannaschia marina]
MRDAASFEAILTALADPTRRAVLDRLREGPLPVGRIAEALPVSRPAVSQHLRVLLEAGLVTVRGEGTRNLYALVPGGAGPLVSWLGALKAMPDAPAVSDRVEHALTTRLTPLEAWTLFCDDLSIWWPVARVSLSARAEGALPQVVLLDPVAGGALREVLYDGSEGTWAEVRTAQKPHAISFAWTLGLSAPAEVTVGFAPDPGGSRLTVSHHAGAAELSDLWDTVMERFAAAANSSLSNF